MDLFEDHASKGAEIPPPLADRMRPASLEEYVGQTHLTQDGKLLRGLIRGKEIPSLLFWGPPGTGKTTLARIVAKAMDSRFMSFSAVLSGVQEIRAVVKEAKDEYRNRHRKTLLFVDEIHRFNKAQQDAFLPHVENGTLTLIGATTENPSFYVNGPLLSRCKVLILEPLTEEDLRTILRRALDEKEKGLGNLQIEIDKEMIDTIAAFSNGDARTALNTVEAAVMMTSPDPNGIRRITMDTVHEAMQKKPLLYDKGYEDHYNVISAFIKAMRGSDPDAGLYWLARMLTAGEDPLFIARRMVIFASEDIGNSDPQAIQVAVSVKEAVDFIGLPEAWIPLAQGVTYLACAPKSNASYAAYQEARKDVEEKGALPVPLHLRNAPTKFMEKIGYGEGYKYPHQYEEGLVAQDYLPRELEGREYYRPNPIGNEEAIRDRLDEIKRRVSSKKEKM